MYNSTYTNIPKDNPMLNNEFLPIPGFEIYCISKDGKISNGRKILKTYKINSGYEAIKFNVNKVKTSHLVHRLVALTYLPTVEGKQYVNHIDGNKLNNNVDNLEWCSNSDNILHARATGLNPYNNPTKGLRIGKTSQYHNVGYDRSRNKWRGSIRHNGKNYGSKRFDTEIEAAKHVNDIIDKYGFDRPKNII